MPIIYRFKWNDVDVVIKYKPKTFEVYERNYGTPLSHIEVDCEQPLPITETGYRSHYIANDALMAYGGALEFVKAWLEEEAQKPDWKTSQAKRQQLCLF